MASVHSKKFDVLDSERALAHHLQNLDNVKKASLAKAEKRRLKNRRKRGAEQTAPNSALENKVKQFVDKLPSAKRPWLRVSALTNLENAFRVMTYNILSSRHTENLEPNDALARFNTSDLKLISLKNRIKQILGEIGRYQPEIICMQEVDTPKDIKRALSYKYEGHFTRTSHDEFEGQIIFFDTSKFELIRFVEHRLWNFITDQNADVSDELFQKLRNSCATTLVLRHKATKQVFAVSTTHLLFSPNRGDIKMLQAESVARHIARLNRQLKIPIILCGDFNSTPESPILKFLKEGELKYGGLPCRSLCGMSREKNMKQGPKCSEDATAQGIPMMSVYGSTSHGEPPFTSVYPGRKASTLDYMFLSGHHEDRIKIRNVLQTLTLPQVMPNENHGSDHIPLCAAFELVGEADEKLEDRLKVWANKHRLAKKRKLQELEKQEKRERQQKLIKKRKNHNRRMKALAKRKEKKAKEPKQNQEQ